MFLRTLVRDVTDRISTGNTADIFHLKIIQTKWLSDATVKKTEKPRVTRTLKEKPTISSSKDYLQHLKQHAKMMYPEDATNMMNSMKSLGIYDGNSFTKTHFYINPCQKKNPATEYHRTFSSFRLCSELQDALQKKGFLNPTTVQLKSIPAIMKSQNFYLCGPNGSGKTLAYLIPLFEKIRKIKKCQSHQTNIKNPLAIILSPTFMLCNQILTECEVLGNAVDVTFGSKINQRLNDYPNILVCTPERVLELHQNCENFDLSSVLYLVMDEADELIFQNNHSSLLSKIVSFVKNRVKETSTNPQFICASATIPGINSWKSFNCLIPNLSLVFFRKHMILPNLQFEFVKVLVHKKTEILVENMEDLLVENRKIVIFCNNIRSAENLYKYLTKNCKFTSVLLEPDNENSALMLLNRFNEGAEVGICTDSMARGVNLTKLDTVINYDFPLSPVIFLHRAGRIGRMSSISQNRPLVLSFLSRKVEVEASRRIQVLSFDNVECIPIPKY